MYVRCETYVSYVLRCEIEWFWSFMDLSRVWVGLCFFSRGEFDRIFSGAYPPTYSHGSRKAWEFPQINYWSQPCVFSYCWLSPTI